MKLKNVLIVVKDKKELTEYGFMVGKISMKEQTVSFEGLKSKSILSEKRQMK